MNHDSDVDTMPTVFSYLVLGLVDLAVADVGSAAHGDDLVGEWKDALRKLENYAK